MTNRSASDAGLDVGHVRERDAGGGGQRAQQVAADADARRRLCKLVGLPPGQRHQLRGRVGRHLRVGDQHILIIRRLADRQERGERVDHALLDPRIDHDGLRRGVGQGVAVRPGAGDDAQAEAAVGASLVAEATRLILA